jgi:hypothetical protein
MHVNLFAATVFYKRQSFPASMNFIIYSCNEVEEIKISFIEDRANEKDWAFKLLIFGSVRVTFDISIY